MLRDYQRRAIQETRIAFGKHKRNILVLPTGAGKTFTASEIIKLFLSKHGGRALILVHRKELLMQWYGSLQKFGIDAGVIIPQNKQFHHQVAIAMVETFYNAKKKNAQILHTYDFVISDEVHLANHFKVLDGYKKHVLGLTATPISSRKSTPLNKVFGDVVLPVTIKELIELGYLCRSRTYSVDHDFSNLRKRGKDFSEETQLEEFTKPKLYEGVVDNYILHCSDTLTGNKFSRGVVFNVNIEHSIQTCKNFNEAGIRSVHIDGTTVEAERRQAVIDLRNGVIDTIHNVGVYNIGFDEPSIETIVLNRATSSISLDKQMRGRGSRPFTFERGEKKSFTVLDMGANYSRHGLFEEPVDWREIFENQNKDSHTKAKKQLRICRECGAVIKLDISACPYCNTSFSHQEIEEAIQEKLTAKEIKEYKFQTLPPHLRVKQSRMSLKELQEFGQHMGYSSKWAYTKYNIFQQYKNK